MKEDELGFVIMKLCSSESHKNKTKRVFIFKIVTIEIVKRSKEEKIILGLNMSLVHINIFCHDF
jgi:hypothetical protein